MVEQREVEQHALGLRRIPDSLRLTMQAAVDFGLTEH